MIIARREGRAEQRRGSERSYAVKRYLPGLSHWILIFYSLWKLIYRLNANSLPAITRKHRRCSVAQKDRINAPIYRHRIAKCRTYVDIVKRRIDRFIGLLHLERKGDQCKTRRYCLLTIIRCRKPTNSSTCDKNNNSDSGQNDEELGDIIIIS